FVVPRGATVREVAERVHKDFAAGLKFARLWGGSKYDGQRVHNDHVVADNDVLEFHL
ncbi:MAG: TGS domain-containing protein, partial [Terriglobia bacterium]